MDCVYLAMPSGLRAPWRGRAARSGKHGLGEKPAAEGTRVNGLKPMGCLGDRAGTATPRIGARRRARC